MTIAEKIKALKQAGHKCAIAGKMDMARIWWGKENELIEKRRKEDEKQD